MKRILKRLGGLLLAVCVLAAGTGVLPTEAHAAVAAVDCGDFADLSPNLWYSNYVDAAVRLQLFYGTSRTTFAPDRAITRGEAVTVLGRLAEQCGGAAPEGIPEVETVPFKDVSPKRYYAKYVAWAKEQNILSGADGVEFQPDRPVTQQELAVLFAKFLEGWNRYEPLEDVDLTGVSDWAPESVRAVSGYDIFPQNRGGPQAAAYRLECAAFFVRLYEGLAYTNDTFIPYRKYAYTRPGGNAAGQERFHILSEACSEDVYYEFVENEADYEKVLEKAGHYGELTEWDETASSPAQVFADGWKFIAIELQAVASPDFTAFHNHRFFSEQSGDVDFCCENPGGGASSDITGYVFLVQVPGDTLDINIYRQFRTGEYKGVPLPADYPVFGILVAGDASRWEETEQEPAPVESRPASPEDDETELTIEERLDMVPPTGEQP